MVEASQLLVSLARSYDQALSEIGKGLPRVGLEEFECTITIDGEVEPPNQKDERGLKFALRGLKTAEVTKDASNPARIMVRAVFTTRED